MPLFSDKVEHGSTSVDATHVEFTAHGRDRGFATRNSTQESITGARYDACLTRVDVSKSVGVQLRDVWLVIYVTRPRVTVVSHTLNKTHAFLETKNPARGLRRRGALSNTH